MKLLFTWCSSFYTHTQQWKEDETILSLVVQQQELGFSTAKVLIASKDTSAIMSQRYAKIGVQYEDNAVTTLFVGRVVSFPSGFDTGSIEVELLSEPPDYQQQLSLFRKSCELRYNEVNQHDTENYQFDNLFFSAEDVQNPTAFLENGNDIFYWDMATGKMSLSNILRGAQQLEISGHDILQNSLKVRLSREPYKVIDLHLTASWIQYNSGIINLIPAIESCFPHGKINSFTNIKHSLENLCKFRQHSGYTLLVNDIKETHPQGIFGQYPVVSPELGPAKTQFKRFYFSGKLICGWHYKQKRTEHVNIKIINSHEEHGRQKPLSFKLGPLQLQKQYPLWREYTHYAKFDTVIYKGNVFQCNDNHISSSRFEEFRWTYVKPVPDALANDASGSFFAETRGKNAIKYAITRAIALMNYSARYIEIECCVSADKFLSRASINNSVKIIDARFPAGYIAGKITAIKFVANADTKTVKLTIGCCARQLDESALNKLSALQLDIPSDTQSIQPDDIVKNVTVTNPPEEQLRLLSCASSADVKTLKHTLASHATTVKVTLHPQNTMRELVRNISLPDFII